MTDVETITPGRAAARIGVTPKIVIRWCDRGDIPGVTRDNSPKRVRQIPLEALRAFLHRKGRKMKDDYNPFKPMVVLYKLDPALKEVLLKAGENVRATDERIILGKLLAIGAGTFVAPVDMENPLDSIQLFNAVKEAFPEVHRVGISASPTKFPLAHRLVANSAELLRELANGEGITNDSYRIAERPALQE